MSKNKMTYDEKRKEYRRKKKEILEFKEVNTVHSCEGCLEHSPEVELHHIIPLRFNGTNEVSNFKRLCKDCHQKLHGLIKVADITAKKRERLAPLEYICDNCTNLDNLKGELVIPESIGGKRAPSNISTLCLDCRLCLGENQNDTGIFDHSKLIMEGFERGREEGKTYGRPKKSTQAVAAILYQMKNPKVVKKRVAESVGIAPLTVRRCKKRLEEKYIVEINEEGTAEIYRKNGEHYRTVDIEVLYTTLVKHMEVV
ncbi:hypothetical protein IRB23SM22_07140 [Alkalibacterium sp. s-m-22]